MWRVLQKISAIVREEMNDTGAQECLLTQLQPAELWQESGRWDTYTKAEGIMFALTDRANREVGLGPTHEEIITAIARDTIRSYRQLPQHLYQIQTKFRDEIRPRFGLMRGREFIMKDGYSFHENEESLKETYYEMDRAYRKMFDRCGLKFRAVEADSGAIGGSGSQEFMVLAEAGEDDILFTEDSSYAANVEKAVSLPPEAVPSHFDKFEKVHTPKKGTIETVCKLLKCDPTQVVKQVLYQVVYDNGTTVLVLVSIRGDRDVNEVKLQNELTKLASEFGAKTTIKLEVPDVQMQSKWAKHALPLGFISPNLENDNIQDSDLLSYEDLKQVLHDFPNQADYFQSLANGIAYQSDKQLYSLSKLINYFKGIANAEDFTSSLQVVKRSRLEVHPKFLRLADRTVADLKNFVTGADEADYHVVGANWGKDFTLPTVVNLDKAKAGDHAVHDPSQILQTARGIEVGHIFQLGTKYSQAMKATFTNEQGEELPLVMGCYGLGVSRLAQAAVEQSYDKDGIIWNKAIAPYHVIVTVPNVGDAKQMDVGERLYTALDAAGVEVLLDDRDERAGVKFKDADLVGIPYRVVTGKAIADGKVEIVNRATKVATLVEIESVVEYLQNELK
jgi:prolyl-tRNA synthetase